MYIECAKCLSLQIEQIPENLAQFYPSDYYSFGGDSDLVSFRDGVRIWARRAQCFSRDFRIPVLRQALHRRYGPLLEPGLGDLRCRVGDRILDVGCGSGVLLRNLRDAGYPRLLGVDPFIKTNKIFALGVRVLKQELSETFGSFDLVMLHHVFEHVTHPSETLREARRLLAVGGRVLLRFPSVPCLAFDEYGADWVQLDAPRHLHIYSRAGIEALAASAGLKLVQWTHDSCALQFWGSEQYRRDIPLFSPQSFAKNPSALTVSQLQEYKQRAASLNVSGRGDQSVAVLTHH